MKRFKMVLSGGAVGVISGVLFVYAGIFKVATDVPHTKPIYWLMEKVRERSIASRARHRGASVERCRDDRGRRSRLQRDVYWLPSATRHGRF